MTRTTETILAELKTEVETGGTMNPKLWLDRALYLATFLGEEINKLADLRLKVAQRELEILNSLEKKNVSEAHLRVQAELIYADMKKQEGRVSQIEELIRVAKLQSRSEGGY